jgi:hypothetical protein
MRRCRTLPPSPPVHPFPRPSLTAGVCFCLQPFLCRLTSHTSRHLYRTFPRLRASATRTLQHTHITPDHHVTPAARPVRRRRGGGVLPAMRRRVRPLRQELPPLSLRLPSMPHCQHTAEPPGTVVLTHMLDMSVLLQQHQDDDEWAVPCLSSAVRRFHY